MRFLTLFISLIIISTGCKKVSKLTQFTMKYDDSVTIPSSTGINFPFNFMSPDITTNSESTFESNNTRKDLIEEIVLQSLDLTVNSPSGEDFSFLKSINIYLSANGLNEIKVAWNDNVSATTGSTLSLETSKDDLKEYIKQDQFSLKVTTVTDEIINSDYEIGIRSVFYVDAKILGL